MAPSDYNLNTKVWETDERGWDKEKHRGKYTLGLEI